MPNKTYEIRDSEGRRLGTVNVEVPDAGVLDFALTPIVSCAPECKPRVDAFLASPRTTLDTRVRSAEHPHNYLGD